MRMKCLIPAAGLGTRMSMTSEQAKEMLPDPKTNKPLIQYSLDLCNKYDLEPLVITRKEKQELNSYLKKNNVPYIVIQPENDWTGSIMASKGLWNDFNLIILPDTRFSPESIIEEIKISLTLGSNFSIALHKVKDPNKWGVVKNYSIYEKPNISEECHAWGIIGFKRVFGNKLLESMSCKVPYKLTNTSLQYFNSFKDLTRTGNLND